VAAVPSQPAADAAAGAKQEAGSKKDNRGGTPLSSSSSTSSSSSSSSESSRGRDAAAAVLHSTPSAVPAASATSRRSSRATARGLRVRKVRFLLPPVVYEQEVELITEGLTKERRLLRAHRGRTHKKKLGSPDSRSRITPADAIRRAEELRAEVCKYLGLRRARLAMASAQRPTSVGGLVRWLMDTGSGLSLLAKSEVPRNCSLEPADPVSLHTANGSVEVASTAAVPALELFEHAHPYVLEDSPCGPQHWVALHGPRVRVHVASGPTSVLHSSVRTGGTFRDSQ
jgi:hypothetical protein